MMIELLASAAVGFGALLSSPIEPVAAPVAEERVIPEKEAKNLKKLVTSAMNQLVKDKQADYYRSLAAIQEEVGKLEEKLKFPALADTAAWSSMMIEALLPKKLPKGMTSNSKFSREIKIEGTKDKFLMSIPKNYKKMAGIPVIVVLHPEMEGRGKFSDKVKKWAENLISDELRKDFVVVVPLNENAGPWSGDDERLLVLRALTFGPLYNLNYDPGRIYLLGTGNAAPEAMRLASFFPSMFSGLIFEGAAADNVPLPNLKNTPVLAVGADAKKFVDASKDAEINVTAADDINGLGDWLGSHSKAFYPEKVTVRANQSGLAAAYWISGVRLDTSGDESVADFATIEAIANREANEIVVTTSSSVREFWVYLNDDLVDLDQPVKIIHNSETRFEGMVKRKIDSVFKYGITPEHGNLGAVFSGRVEIVAN